MRIIRRCGGQEFWLCWPLESGRPVYEIVISFEVAAALRELQLLDSDCERLVFRIRPRDTGAILAATEDGLEELIGAVAADANHEVGRRCQQRLDAAFEALSDAAQSVRNRRVDAA